MDRIFIAILAYCSVGLGLFLAIRNAMLSSRKQRVYFLLGGVFSLAGVLTIVFTFS